MLHEDTLLPVSLDSAPPSAPEAIDPEKPFAFQNHYNPRASMDLRFSTWSNLLALARTTDQVKKVRIDGVHCRSRRRHQLICHHFIFFIFKPQETLLLNVLRPRDITNEELASPLSIRRLQVREVLLRRFVPEQERVV